MRAITPKQIDGLGVVAEVRLDSSGVLRSTKPGPNLDSDEGARQAPGVMQMGLTERELEKLRERIHDMLDDLEGRQNPNWPDKESGPAFKRTWD